MDNIRLESMARGVFYVYARALQELGESAIFRKICQTVIGIDMKKFWRVLKTDGNASFKEHASWDTNKAARMICWEKSPKSRRGNPLIVALNIIEFESSFGV